MVFDKWKEEKYTIYGSYELGGIDYTIVMKLNLGQIIRKEVE